MEGTAKMPKRTFDGDARPPANPYRAARRIANGALIVDRQDVSATLIAGALLCLRDHTDDELDDLFRHYRLAAESELKRGSSLAILFDAAAAMCSYAAGDRTANEAIGDYADTLAWYVVHGDE